MNYHAYNVKSNIYKTYKNRVTKKGTVKVNSIIADYMRVRVQVRLSYKLLQV